MSIEVLRNVNDEDVIDTYMRGESWRLDGWGHLTINDAAGEDLAAYVPRGWLSVRKRPDERV